MAAASSHLAAFERFERWAVRSVSSDVRMRGLQALRETLFAPLRRDRAVSWAEVQWESGQVLQYRTPLADSALSFVSIEAPTLGRVLVAVCESCNQAGQTSECVVIERPARQRPTRVRMAFCKPIEQPQAKAPQRKARAPKLPQARAQLSR